MQFVSYVYVYSRVVTKSSSNTLSEAVQTEQITPPNSNGRLQEIKNNGKLN